MLKRYEDQIKNKEQLNLNETALYLEKSTRTIIRWANKGIIKRYYGRGYGMQGFYKKSELDEFYQGNLWMFFK